MIREQVQRLSDLRRSIALNEEVVSRQRELLRTLVKQCDHRYSNGRSALKRTSTHPADCGSYKECAVCAGEQAETFVNVCRICKKQETINA